MADDGYFSLKKKIIHPPIKLTELYIIAGEWIVFLAFIFSLGFAYGGKAEHISKWYLQRSILLTT